MADSHDATVSSTKRERWSYISLCLGLGPHLRPMLVHQGSPLLEHVPVTCVRIPRGSLMGLQGSQSRAPASTIANERVAHSV